jgi:hypothetical protein
MGQQETVPVKELALTRGLVALVDDADYEALNCHKWYAIPHGRTFYARRNIRLTDGRRSTIAMHQQLLSGHKVDHRDRNGLNNQRDTLRRASHAQNQWNQAKHSANGSSQYKGVSLRKESGRWKALIQKDNKTINLGTFDIEIDAARAYDAAAMIHHGEFANLNFPAAPAT